jgi:hypothetical protein
MTESYFRGRKPEDNVYEEAKEKAIRNMSWYNKNVHTKYLEGQALLRKDLRDMSKSIDKELNDKARQEEDLRQHPWREENCPENAKNCIKGACEYIKDACTSVFPKKYTTTTPYSKKNNGGKKSRKSHNSKKYKKSKKSHTTYKKSKRSRR